MSWRNTGSNDRFVQSLAWRYPYPAAMRLFLACCALAVRAAAQDITVPLTREHWTFTQLYARDKHLDTARFETYLGRPALLVPSGFGFVNGASFRNGTIEADFAMYP